MEADLRRFSAREMKPVTLKVEFLLQPTSDEQFRVSLAASVAPHIPIIFNGIVPVDPNRERAYSTADTIGTANSETFEGMPMELAPNFPVPIPVTRTSWKEALDLYGLDIDAPRPRTCDGRLFDYLEPSIDRYLSIAGKTNCYESDAGYPVVTQFAARANKSAEFRNNYGQFLIGIGYLDRCHRLRTPSKLAFQIHDHQQVYYEHYELQENGDLRSINGPVTLTKMKPAGDRIKLVHAESGQHTHTAT